LRNDSAGMSSREGFDHSRNICTDRRKPYWLSPAVRNWLIVYT
jgi:hypothetical protein